MANIDLNFDLDWQARATLILVERMSHWGNAPIPDLPGLRLQTFPIYNGRERHVAIIADFMGSALTGAVMVSFGEERNSDGLVVQRSAMESAPFNAPSSADLTDEGYESRQVFSCGDIMGAAEAVMIHLRVFVRAFGGP